MATQAKQLFEFDRFRVDPHERLLFRDGEPIPLTPKAFDMLLAFVENSGRLLEKEELMRSLWPDSFVEEANLSQNVSLLRKALGEREGQKFIQTVPRRGYRFIADVRGVGDSEISSREKSSSDIAGESKGKPDVSENYVEPGRTGANKVIGPGRGAHGILRQRPQGAVLIVSLAVATVVAVFLINRLVKTEQGAGRAIKSIAVLPFKSLGADNADEYLGVGIAETLTTRLGSLKLLTVRPSSAVLKYVNSEKETGVAGRELNVDSVLEGSIRRLGERLRITVRLVRVSDVSLLWADHFDENFTDIFKVEDSISTKVASSLAIKLSGDEERSLIKRYTDNPEAYQLYLKGRFFWNKRTGEGFKIGISQFKQAVEKDPEYALAYSGLADSYTGLTFYNFASPNETMPKAKEAATNALAMDNTLAEAHASLAHVKANYDWEWSEAEQEFRRSIELKPDYATAHQWYAIHYLTPRGQLEEALKEMKRAIELEPTSLVMNSFLGATLYFSGRYDEAIEQCRKTIEMDSNFAVAHWHLGLVYQQKGMYEEAISELQKAITLSGNSPLMIAALGHAYAKAGKRNEANRVLDELQKLSVVSYVSSLELAAIYAAFGETEQAFKWLEESYQERCFHLVNLNVRPEFAPLRRDPRFNNLVRRIGLPQ
ncbi:MAG TPA: tetratricopeptide repeat protein [Blastocatellia bacterium]|nr:tetratricopeptide repeat protein [Blastocatellia bacterium]